MSLPAASRLFRSALRAPRGPAAPLTTKPAKHHISAGEQAVVMATMFLAILGPSCWIMAHLEDYKKRD